MNSDFAIAIGADYSNVEEACAEAQVMVDKVNEETQRMEQVTRRSITRSVRVLSGMVGITMSVFSMLGGTLDPMGDAIMGMIHSTISALQAVSMAMASNPITAAIAGITATWSIYLSTMTMLEVSRGINRSKNEMRKVQDTLRMAHSAYILFKGAEM